MYNFRYDFQDKGAFNTTLSDEWMHLQRSNKLSLEELFKLNLEAVKHIFLDNPSKQDIRNAMVSWFYTYMNKQHGDDPSASVIDSETCKFAVIHCNVSLTGPFVEDHLIIVAVHPLSSRFLCF